VFRLNPGNPHEPHNRPGPLGTAAGFRLAPAWHWPCKCNHDGRRNGRRRPKQPLHAISEDFKRVCTARKRGLAISLRHRELMRHNRCQTFGGKHVPLVEVGTRLRSHLMSSGGSGTIALTCIYWSRLGRRGKTGVEGHAGGLWCGTVRCDPDMRPVLAPLEWRRTGKAAPERHAR
jgi:hypothetical protein